MEEEDSKFNVYVGAETGVLKGVHFGQDAPVLKNFHSFEQLDECSGISSMTWADESQKELIVSFENHLIKVYNTKLRTFTSGISIDEEVQDSGKLIAVYPYVNGSYIVGYDNGDFGVWNALDPKGTYKINTGGHLAKIRQCPENGSIIATGGKENDLKLWNISSSKTEPIFKAKNVPHDNLDLRIPVWIQDLAFMPHREDIISVATRYGHVRLYDTKVNNKCRPVINMELMDHALMALSTTNDDKQVLVGSSQGKLGLVDFRLGNKATLARSYGGFSGSIRSIGAHQTLPYFVSCGLDRHLYLHHLEQKKPLKKLYLKSRLTNVLMSNDFNLEDHSTLHEKSGVWQNISMDVLSTSKCAESNNNSTTEAVPPSKKKKISS